LDARLSEQRTSREPSNGARTLAHAFESSQARSSRVRRLTRLGRVPTLCRFSDRKGDLLDETDVSTQSAPASQDARLPEAHEDEGRAKSVEAASREGPETPDRLTGGLSRSQRLTTSADFQALFQRGKRIDRPALIVLWREADEPTRVGFAVSRQVRSAVQRNRARRRLREAYRATRTAAPERAMLVIIGRPVALTARFETLIGQMRQALAAIPGSRSS
jgi:ribonuclease P protein component